MKYTAALLALAAAVASAQDLALFPECSLPCIIDAVGKETTCELMDFPCVCKSMEAVKTAATPCVVEKCGQDVALSTFFSFSSPSFFPLSPPAAPLLHTSTYPVITGLPHARA
jgi:hypothetical protein